MTRADTLLVNYSYLADGSKASAERADGTGLVYRGSLTYRRDPSGALTLEGVPFASGRLTPDGVRYHVTDHLGSVRAVVDGTTGDILEAGNYGVYGARSAAATGTWPTGSLPAGETLRHRFTGKEDQGPDFGLALTDFGARLYSPALRRWLSPDPLGEKYYELSPYAYCAGDPVNLVDWDGRVIGDYYNYSGYYVASDGLQDGKLFLIDGDTEKRFSQIDKDYASFEEVYFVLHQDAVEIDGLIVIERKDENSLFTQGEFLAIGKNGFKGYTIERPGPPTTTPNQNKSIPTGMYDTQALDYEFAGDFAFLISNAVVPSSRGIYGHVGNTSSDSRGCILFGMELGLPNNSIYHSKKAMQNFRRFYSDKNIVKMIIR